MVKCWTQFRSLPSGRRSSCTQFNTIDNYLENARDSLNILLRSYSGCALMIVDEIGYLSLNREESNLLFQLVSYRYEKSSTLFTSNKSFPEWGEAIGDQVIASAIPDRILHHCKVLNVKGESYKLKDRRKGNPLPYKEK